MLKIYPKICQNVQRYCCKNTINARYNRNMDLSALMSIGLCTQLLRIPDWQIHDAPLTALIACTGVKGLFESLRNRILLMPIRKRAKAIKKASKN